MGKRLRPAEELRYEYWPEGRMQHPSQFLPLKERDRRWNKIRDEMRKNGLDCIIAYDGPIANQLSGVARYVTNCHGTNDAWVFVPIKGNITLLPWLETVVDLTKRMVWPEVDVIIGGPGVPTWALANLIKEHGYEKGTIGVVGLSDYNIMEGWVPYTAYTNLQTFLPEAKFENATTMMTDIKAIKSEEEIKLIEKASEIADKAIETLAMYAKPGVMEQELWARIMYTIISNGGDASFAGSQHIMTTGNWVHQAWSIQQHHMIQNGDVIVTEFYPRYGGYVSHPHQPLFVGKVHQDYERCYEVLIESVKAGFYAMTPAHTWNEVAEAFAKPVREAGMWGINVVVHGIGITMPDPPFLPMPGALRTKVDPKYPGYWVEAVPELEPLWRKFHDYLKRRVEPNMVIAIEPRAILPPDNRGLHMGPTVVTTEGTPRILTKYGREVLRV